MKILRATSKSVWGQLAALAIEVANIFVPEKYKKTKIALEITSQNPIKEEATTIKEKIIKYGNR